MLATRVATAVVGIPIIFGLIWIDGWPYAVVVAVVLAIAAAEFAHLRYEWLHIFSFFIAAPAAMYSVVALAPDEVWLGVVVATGWLPGAVVFGPWPRARERARKKSPWWWGWSLRYSDGAFVSIGVAYLAVLGSTIVLLRDLASGRDWVYLALFSTFAVDTAAYFVGRAIGRHKLAPSISPKKTWEGFFGGYAGGIAAVLLLNYFLGLRIDAGPALLIALTLPVAATLGDLFESWVKRRAGVKDASELIPGHGGVLDRLDSVLFVFPLVYIVARWIV